MRYLEDVLADANIIHLQKLNMKFHETRYFIIRITFKQIHFYGHEDAEPQKQ